MTIHQMPNQEVQVLAFVVLLVFCLSSVSYAQEEVEEPQLVAVDSSTDNIMMDTASISLWTSFINLCDIIAPYCGVICFLAPLPTIYQISRDKTVGNLPLLPYSSMLSNSVSRELSLLLLVHLDDMNFTHRFPYSLYG